jgi:hypothetical protein
MHPEDDPTAIEPKPAIDGMPPEEGVAPPTDEEEQNAPDVTPLSHNRARHDDTIDDEEQPDQWPQST